MGGIIGQADNLARAAQTAGRQADAIIADATPGAVSRFFGGRLDTKEIAESVAALSVPDPRRAADVLEAVESRLSVSQRQALTTDLDAAMSARQRQAAEGQLPSGLSDADRAALLDMGQLALDLVGLADPTPVSDGVNGVISLFRGDFFGAGVSAVSMIPYIGDAAKLGKMGRWAQTVAGGAEMVARYGADSAAGRAALSAMGRIGDALDALPRGVFDRLPASAQQSILEMQSTLTRALGRTVDAPGSLSHKAQRWDDYQARGGDWSYDRWSTSYDNNVGRARAAHRAVDDYHAGLDWGRREVTVDVEIGGETVRRRLDIADPSELRGVEYKTGYQTNNEANRFEIERDAQLVRDGWEIEWVIEGTASRQLLENLAAAGIAVKFR